jgi:iron(III) transport system permease protein
VIIMGLAQTLPVADERSKPALIDNTIVGWLSRRSFAVVVLAVTALTFVTPLVYVFKDAFEGNATGLREMFDNGTFWQLLRTSLWLALGSSAIATVLGVSLAWFAHRLPPGRRWMGYIPFIPLLIPQLAFVLGYLFLLAPSAGFLNTAISKIIPVGGSSGPVNIYTLPWMIIILGVSLTSFVFLFVRASLAQMPQDVIDAALASGSSPIATFWRVVIPLITPGLLYGSLTTLLLAFGQFTVPLLLGGQNSIYVLTTALYYQIGRYPTDYALASAYGVPILVIGLFFLVVQRIMLRNQDQYVTTSTRGARPMSSNGVLAQTMLVLYGILTAVLPITALLIVSFQPTWIAQIRPSQFTLVNYRTVLFDRPDLLNAIEHSLEYGFTTALISLPLGYYCALAIYRRREQRILANLQDIVVSLPLGIPAVILGTGFLFAFIDGPIRVYGQPASMVILYTAMMIPYATRLQLVAMTGLGQDLMDAAAANGAGPIRRTLTVQIPLLRPTIGFAVALIIVLTSHEFAASVLVRSATTQVMGSALYDLYSFGSYPLTAVMTLLMCVVTGVGVVIALLIGGRGALGKTETMG